MTIIRQAKWVVYTQLVIPKWKKSRIPKTFVHTLRVYLGNVGSRDLHWNLEKFGEIWKYLLSFRNKWWNLTKLVKKNRIPRKVGKTKLSEKFSSFYCSLWFDKTQIVSKSHIQWDAQSDSVHTYVSKCLSQLKE